ncbi:MAG TPA: glycosyltransferase [Acidimicrobiia bacterium]|nr:glycosyltransferase [Acidimicrobiia bacterium]
MTGRVAAKRVLLFRPEMGDGGADRITLTVLELLDRNKFMPMLALVRARGVLLSKVPSDVPIIDLGASRLVFAVPALARAIRRADPDIIFSTSGGGNAVAVAARMLARSRARLVLSERSAVFRDTVSRRRRALELPLKRFAYRHADLVTAVSDGVARELVERLALPPALVRTVFNPVLTPGADAAAREPVVDPWFAPDAITPVFVACGRLVAQKDYPTMLAAFTRLRCTHDARLAILGEGPLRASLEDRVRALGLTAHVRFLGFDPNPLKYMARARALLQSSVVEGLPGVLIQAMGVGTPVIATDCNHGPREVVRDGVDGWLVPVGDSDGIARRAAQILDEPGLRERFAEAARIAAKRFAFDVAMPVYERALTGEPELAA